MKEDGWRHRRATRGEREMLDDARRKLVLAFMKGDGTTFALACEKIRQTLAKMEVGDGKGCEEKEAGPAELEQLPTVRGEVAAGFV